MFINDNLCMSINGHWTSKGEGKQNAHEMTTIKEIGERRGEEAGIQMKTHTCRTSSQNGSGEKARWHYNVACPWRLTGPLPENIPDKLYMELLLKI